MSTELINNSLIESLNKHISIFEDNYNILNKSNIVIGGIFALKLHGLDVRETKDLDIIIYKPTEEQLEFLLNEINPQTNEPDKDGDYRSYKAEINGIVLDFLIEKELEIPYNLLLYSKDKIIYYKVQSIANVVSAKSKYKRTKDLMDFIELKNKNFNIDNTQQKEEKTWSPDSDDLQF